MDAVVSGCARIRRGAFFNDLRVMEGKSMSISVVERIALGCIGGTAVALGSYPFEGGYGEVLSSMDLGRMGGYALRLIGFACVGGFWAYLHDDETNKKRVFELGIVAPAVIVGLIYANKPPKPLQNALEAAEPTRSLVRLNGISFGLIGSAQAQSTDKPEPVSQPSDSLGRRLLEGFLGIKLGS